MTPTDILREEHRIILQALDVLETGAERLARGGALPEGWWAELIEWLRAFADRNHHAKEERSLFPAMVKAGVPSEGGPIGVMLEEHTQGRALVRAMVSGPPAERPSVAGRYIRLLREHIEKEDEIVFPLADEVLDERAVTAVAREFESAQIEQGREGDQAVARATLDRLSAALG